MKSFAFVLLLCLSASSLFAQQPHFFKDSTAFNDYTTKLDKQRQALAQQKSYPAVVALLQQWVERFDELPNSLKPGFKHWEAAMYYNLACYNALASNKEGALTAFEKSAKAGWSKYWDTIHDTDLASLRAEKRYLKALEIVRRRGDAVGYVLRGAGPYDNKIDASLPKFSYQNSDTSSLVNFKNKYNLDSVAGNGDEIARIKNLLLWVHNTIRHDGSADNPQLKNGSDLIEICKKENRGVNCRMMATTLKDVYQAEGFKARVVICMPKDSADVDCHVINVVWSNTLSKWVWMDPTFNAYVADSKGNLLSIEEVREKLHRDQINDLVLNKDANWNNQNKKSRDDYLGYYMSKNLYWLQCATSSQWDIETDKPGKQDVTYINLYPRGYGLAQSKKRMASKGVQYATNNPALFWQKP